MTWYMAWYIYIYMELSSLTCNLRSTMIFGGQRCFVPKSFHRPSVDHLVVDVGATPMLEWFEYRGWHGDDWGGWWVYMGLWHMVFLIRRFETYRNNILPKSMALVASTDWTLDPLCLPGSLPETQWSWRPTHLLRSDMAWLWGNQQFWWSKWQI